MAQDTVNYGLKKNELIDDTPVALVTNQAANMDIIDTQLKNNADAIDVVEQDIEIINTAVSDTGLVNAMVVNTAGTFNMLKNGNVTPFIIPLFTNTGSATLNIDGGGVTGIRKANDAGTLVVLEAGDIKKNVPTQFVLDTVSGFFVYAPKSGGSNIKSMQRGLYDRTGGTSTSISISTVVVENSILLLGSNGAAFLTPDNPSTITTSGVLNSTSISLTTPTASTGNQYIPWTVVEFKKLKSRQTGSRTTSPASSTFTVTAVDLAKALFLYNYRISTTSTTPSVNNLSVYLQNSTTVNYNRADTTGVIVWQLVEFE